LKNKLLHSLLLVFLVHTSTTHAVYKKAIVGSSILLGATLGTFGGYKAVESLPGETSKEDNVVTVAFGLLGANMGGLLASLYVNNAESLETASKIDALQKVVNKMEQRLNEKEVVED